jgi:uroporphyrin-III C-methyltransferase/precorrin-2 dehydrogenase/sirohydrochlorin ferrochelatase/uroporphyrin-III C-methyltransferase
MRDVKGKVIIAGAGPGDPGLVTIKTACALQQADVILTDRLVNREIIEQFAKPRSQVIEVGKQGGKLHSTPQETINQLLVKYAATANLVVRLKGGDVSVFANVLDELETLVQHRIPFEIIPGITAASGAAAYTGIPLTARNYSTSVRFLTYYHSEVIPQKVWKQLARTEDTLVFYMSAQSLHELSAQLIRHGMDAAMPLAIVEQATTAAQRVHLMRIDEAQKMNVEEVRTPALMIIGKVAALHEQFRWFNATDALANPFHELPPQVISSTLKQIVS